MGVRLALPRGGSVVAHSDAMIVRNDRQVNGLNGFRVRFDPADLIATQVDYVAGKDGLLTQRYGEVAGGPLEFRNEMSIYSN